MSHHTLAQAAISLTSCFLTLVSTMKSLLLTCIKTLSTYLELKILITSITSFIVPRYLMADKLFKQALNFPHAWQSFGP